MLREIDPELAFRLAWAGENILAVDMEEPQLSDWMWFNPRLRSCRFLIEEETKE